MIECSQVVTRVRVKGTTNHSKEKWLAKFFSVFWVLQDIDINLPYTHYYSPGSLSRIRAGFPECRSSALKEAHLQGGRERKGTER